VETDALQLPASAGEREAPLLHRISLGGLGCAISGRGSADVWVSRRGVII
jgi:hypothetical protein